LCKSANHIDDDIKAANNSGYTEKSAFGLYVTLESGQIIPIAATSLILLRISGQIFVSVGDTGGGISSDIFSNLFQSLLQNRIKE
jgi:hypothetical protein